MSSLCSRRRSHKTFKRTIANWASIYELPGTNLSLKPLFLTAHQDVVPVLPATLSQWDQPPYSGHYDGTYIWGRGASDTKGSLIAIMVAIEHLLETTDFKPERTIVLGFGSDEERGGQVSRNEPKSGTYEIGRRAGDRQVHYREVWQGLDLAVRALRSTQMKLISQAHRRGERSFQQVGPAVRHAGRCREGEFAFALRTRLTLPGPL